MAKIFGVGAVVVEVRCAYLNLQTKYLMRYRRLYAKGARYFFTVNLADRSSTLLVDHIDTLRQALRNTKNTHPFEIIAMVVLPEHLHAIWQLPEGEDDFSTRWGLIKMHFSKGIPKNESISTSRQKNGERGIWQRRFWEHKIRNDEDEYNHIDYIHFNPVKHGYCSHPADWPYSSVHQYIRQNRWEYNAKNSEQFYEMAKAFGD